MAASRSDDERDSVRKAGQGGQVSTGIQNPVERHSAVGDVKRDRHTTLEADDPQAREQVVSLRSAERKVGEGPTVCFDPLYKAESAIGTTSLCNPNVNAAKVALCFR